MKSIRYYIIAAAFAYAPLHAMEDQSINIVDYDLQKHGETVKNLFLEAFPDEDAPDTALIDPKAQPNINVSVLEINGKATAFTIYEKQTIPVSKTFRDIAQYQPSKTELKVMRVHYIGVDKEHRRIDKQTGKGFGKRILEHIKSKAEQSNSDIIALQAAYHSRPFYEKNGYTKTLPNSVSMDCMALPLNEDVGKILEAVRELRIKNVGKGILFTHDLI
jgi:GNAT superfamily N-acetyltransferase